MLAVPLSPICYLLSAFASRLSPDQLRCPGAGDPGNRASGNKAAFKGNALAAGELDAVGGRGRAVGINKRCSAGALDEQVVAGGVGGKQGAVGCPSRQRADRGRATDGRDAVGNVSL